MKTYRVAVVGGDGTGPEVVAEAVKVLEAAAQRYGFTLDLTPIELGWIAICEPGRRFPGKSSPKCVSRMPSCSGLSGTLMSHPASSSRTSCSGCDGNWASTSTSGR